MYVIGLMLVNALKKRNTMKENRMNLKTLDKNQLSFGILILIFILSTFYILINVLLKNELNTTETIICNTLCFISLIKIINSISAVV